MKISACAKKGSEAGDQSGVQVLGGAAGGTGTVQPGGKKNYQWGNFLLCTTP